MFGHRGFVARFVSSWMVPLAMVGAYAFMMLTAETDSTVDRATRVAWMSLGLAFVLVVWWIIKMLVEVGAFARAVEIGDADRLDELCAGRRGARIAVYRALAGELRGDWPAALAALDAAEPPAKLRALAASVRIAALVATGDLVAARRALDAFPSRRTYADELLARLGSARVRVAEGDPTARDELARLETDVRAGARIREVAGALLRDQKRPVAATPS